MNARYNTTDADRHRTPGAIWRLPPLHPFLVAVFPVLATYAVGVNAIEPSELILPLSIALGAAALLMAACCLAFGHRERGALAASWIILIFFAYQPFVGFNAYLASSRIPIHLPASYAVPALVGLGIVGLFLLKRSPEDQEADDQFSLTANVAAMVALAIPAVNVAWALCGGWFMPAGESSEPARQYAPPTAQLAAPADRRDVYYLVLRNYPNADTLRSACNYDDQPFLQRLRRRGFVVAERSQTTLDDPRAVLAANLCLQHPQRLPTLPLEHRRMLVRHDVGRMLRDVGYKYVHLGAAPDGLRWNSLADENYHFAPLPTEFSESLLHLTMASPWFPSLSARSQIAHKVERVTTLADEQGAKFVVALLPLPGTEYRYDSDGSPLTTTALRTRTPRESYLHQLVYTASLVERMVDSILLKSRHKPIIIVQSDSGLPASLRDPKAPLDSTRGVLTAIYLPQRELRGKVPADLAPENTFRFVLREAFQVPLELAGPAEAPAPSPFADLLAE